MIECKNKVVTNHRISINSYIGVKSPKLSSIWSALFTSVLLIFASGCSSVNDFLKAEPAQSAGFLPAPELLSKMRERYPFHGVWMNMNAKDFREYRSVYIAPMDTSHLTESDWWGEASLRAGNLDEDAATFAAESEEIFKELFADGMKLKVVDKPGPDTVIIELSIVELTPAKTWLSAIGLGSFAAPLIVGVPVGTIAALVGNGTVAIEGILRDGESEEIMLMFADREASKTRILDLQTLTWYGHANEIMEDWAHQLMEVLTTPHDHMVADSDGFAWAPL